jgi:hypothetical protein
MYTFILSEAELCGKCGKSLSSTKSLTRHMRMFHRLVPLSKLSCKKCNFVTLFRENLNRHDALKHVRGRSQIVPRRSISTSKKLKAIEYMETSKATTPERRAYLQRTFSLTPKTQNRLFKKKDKFKSAKKCLFREKGGGRPVDEFWKKIEVDLLKRFLEQRAAGAQVQRRHLLAFVYQICADLNINLATLAQEKGWKNPTRVLQNRIIRFCRQNEIKMKRASRQVHKDQEVNHQYVVHLDFTT